MDGNTVIKYNFSQGILNALNVVKVISTIMVPSTLPMTAVGLVDADQECNQQTSMCQTFPEPGQISEKYCLPLAALQISLLPSLHSHHCLNMCLKSHLLGLGARDVEAPLNDCVIITTTNTRNNFPFLITKI